MSRFAVLVDFRCKKGTGSRFLELVAENAAASVRDEPGCYRFDVLTERDADPDTVFLYEIYENEAAFEAHLETPHFAAFQEAVAGIVDEMSIRKCDVTENAV